MPVMYDYCPFLIVKEGVSLDPPLKKRRIHSCWLALAGCPQYHTAWVSALLVLNWKGNARAS